MTFDMMLYCQTAGQRRPDSFVPDDGKSPSGAQRASWLYAGQTSNLVARLSVEGVCGNPNSLCSCPGDPWATTPLPDVERAPLRERASFVSFMGPIRASGFLRPLEPAFHRQHGQPPKAARILPQR